MKHIIETSNGNRTLVDIANDCEYVQPMIDAYYRDSLTGAPDPSYVAIRPLGDVHYEPFVMHADEIVAESDRRRALR